MTNNCPPHHWYVPRAEITEGVVLARCMHCTATQYQPIEVSINALLEANELNKKRHLIVFPVTKKTFAQFRQYNRAPVRESSIEELMVYRDFSLL